ncbi:MAG TPA: glycosyltransferase family 39 protein [Leptospiraceae bacterium]|nr:glycosyltransferase family 39 protein [Leptospiraceae bacterium]
MIIYILIVLFTFLFYIPYLGTMPLFDWDELNFAESAREMLITGDYFRVTVNFLPFWEKPPLFFWMQALSMKVFGVNEFGARFPNVLAGAATFSLIYHIGRKYYDSLFGILWVLSFFGSFLPHLYFKTGIIDPFFNLLIFSGIFFIFKALNTDPLLAGNEVKIQKWRTKNFLFSGLLIGTAILTKGPAALLITLLCAGAYYVLNGFRKYVKFKEILIFGTAVFCISFFWFGPETIINGFWFIQRFVMYQLELAGTSQAGHGQPVYYHAVVLFFGCFPVSMIFLFGRVSGVQEDGLKKNLNLWMAILFWTVFILFSLITTKILHYSSLCYLPMTYFAARKIRYTILQRQEMKITRTAVLSLGAVFSAVFALLPYAASRMKDFAHLGKDEYIQESMKIQVNWEMYGSAAGIILAAVIILYFILSRKNQFLKAYAVLFLGTAFVFEFLLFYLVPKINEYTQAELINFYREAGTKNAYLEVVGYKSYGYLFYSKKQPSARKEAYDKNWLLFGETDKDSYFSVKTGTGDMYRLSPGIKELYRKNGYIFMMRPAQKKE